MVVQTDGLFLSSSTPYYSIRLSDLNTIFIPLLRLSAYNSTVRRRRPKNTRRHNKEKTFHLGFLTMSAYHNYLLTCLTMLNSLTSVHGIEEAEKNGDSGASYPPDASKAFCTGMMPMSMFMDGFRTARPENSCLMYFVKDWVLDTEEAFQGAMVFSFLLALSLEALSAVRGIVKQHVVHHTHLIVTLIYAVQGFLGYIVMFLAMTYSIELLLSTIAGICIGNLLFFRYEARIPPTRRAQLGVDHTSEQLEDPLLSNDS